MTSASEVKDVLNSLDAKRRELEATLAEKHQVLNHNNIGMDESLVDDEGFPRNDIDVYQVRHARHDIVCLRNDLKGLMKQFEENLYKLHSLTASDPEAPAEVASKELAFAKVASTENLSPAYIDGLVEDDEILQFGSITETNFKSMKDISELVQHSVDRDIPLRVRRKGREFKVTLRPRRWAGRGVLGCTIVPIDNPGPDR